MNSLNCGFRHWQVSGLSISVVLAVQKSTVQILLHFSHKGASLTHLGRFLSFTRQCLPQFRAIIFSCQSIPFHSPNKNIPDTTLHVQPAKCFYLIQRNFCEKKLVLGRLLNTVKWSTFCVSFVCVLTILGQLQCLKIFKIDYVVTSNVQFGMVSINSVTYQMTKCFDHFCSNTCRLDLCKAFFLSSDLVKQSTLRKTIKKFPTEKLLKNEKVLRNL